MARVHCLVPHCTRTHKPFPEQLTHPDRKVEWVCAGHWLATSRNTRRLYFKAKRRRRWGLAYRLWDRLTRQAIERAGGIG